MPSDYAGRAAGKTGTTENSADAWFCGFDPKLATAVWMGYPRAESPCPEEGATYCVPIWGATTSGVRLQAVAEFAKPAKLPVYTPWHGKYSKMAPRLAVALAVAVEVGQGPTSRAPSRPQTITAKPPTTPPPTSPPASPSPRPKRGAGVARAPGVPARVEAGRHQLSYRSGAFAVFLDPPSSPRRWS